jgi:membrane protease YdiL (CAAX protease family)
VQTVLIPLTIVGFQSVNFLRNAQGGAWNHLCGIAVVFGTYFLWVLGPRSLASEGPALWMTLTWPRGLESLLRAKARLWTIIATAVVALILAYAMMRHPLDAWKIALVGLGWFAFGRSMAEKAVTLVTVPSSSADQAEPVPRARRWAASLGMLTFGAGIVMQQWHLAIVGIVYSWMTAAAMWQNFRAHLPFLYDPWSETLPRPPTLMHAMIAISVLVEGGAAATVIAMLTLGGDNAAASITIAYGFSASVVCVAMSVFLSGKGVAAREVWRWDGGASPVPRPAVGWTIGAIGGAALACFALAYGSMLSRWPAVSEMLETSTRTLDAIPNLRVAYAVMAIAFAPVAEEYLFRGLLFRALDREWGGWRAVVGSGAFFAVYHSPLAWVPVAIVGMTNALLFKRTGSLVPAVVLHMVYNAVVCASDWGRDLVADDPGTSSLR